MDMDGNKFSYRLQLARHNAFRAIKAFFNKPKLTAPKRILIGGSTLLGDMVMMAPLVQALKAEFPAAAIDILVPKGWSGFAKHMLNIDEAYESQLNNGQWFKCFRKDHHDTWDLAVIPFAYSLIPFFYALGVKQLRSFPDPKNRRAYQIHQCIPVPQKAVHMSRMMLALSSQPDGQFLAPHFDAAPDKLPLELDGKHYVILHPGASHPPRFWPAECFAAVAKHFHKKGFEIVLTGSPGEDRLTNPIEEQLDFPVFNLAGKTSLEALLAVCAHASCVLGPDTGIMHLARAVNVPSVTLMGQTQNEVYGVDPGLHHADSSQTIYIDQLPCRDFKTVFKYKIPGIANCRRHHCQFDVVKCLDPVTSEQIIQNMNEVMT